MYEEGWPVASRVQQAIDASPMAEVAGEYVQLTAGHSGHLQGICPFCKTGTLDVTPWVMREVNLGSHGLWYCFGCTEGGDVLTFIIKITGLDLLGAIDFLMARAALMDELRLLG